MSRMADYYCLMVLQRRGNYQVIIANYFFFRAGR
jgi:hypothetical protein